jgi:hypothetical protein
MNEIEGSYEDRRYGSVAFQFPHDEAMAPSTEAIQMTRDAICFVLDIVSASRTAQSALLKLACVRSVFGGGETSQEIARRYRVSTRAVQLVKKNLRSQFLGRAGK